MVKIKVLAGGGFVEQEVRSVTICELREELGIDAGAAVAVNGQNKANSYTLRDDDLVAAVSNDKTGGVTRGKTKPVKAKGRPRVQSTTITKAYNNLIFTQKYPTLVLFTDLKDLDKLPVKDAFEEASKEERFKHKILFAKADKD
jgi:hypothetical protein